MLLLAILTGKLLRLAEKILHRAVHTTQPLSQEEIHLPDQFSVGRMTYEYIS